MFMGKCKGFLVLLLQKFVSGAMSSETQRRVALRKFLCIFSLLLFASTASAIGFKISGVVVDESSDEPLPYANVCLFQNNEQIKGTVTDLEGRFLFSQLTEGAFRIEISYMGFKTKKLNVRLSSDRPYRVFKRIPVQEDAELLSAVEVTAKRSSFQADIDKKTFLVNESAVADGMSASEVLKEIPSVAVDVDGNVSVRNNENVEIYINGRPSGMTDDSKGDILEQLPAGSIEKVEVITNPSSRFAAEGSAGIINIVLKQSGSSKSSYFGSVSGGITYPWGGKPGGNVNGNISVTKNKWTTTASVGYNNKRSIGGGKSERESYKAADTTYIDQVRDADFNMNSVFIRLGTSCQIDTANRVGLQGMFSYGRREREQLIDYSRGAILGGRRNLSTFQERDALTDNVKLVGKLDLDYLHTFSDSHTLSAAVGYSINSNDNDRDYQQKNYDSLKISTPAADYDQQQTTLNKNSSFDVQVDYVNPITSKSKLEAGLKADIENQSSDVESFIKQNGQDVFTPQQNLYNDFELRQDVYSAYASYGNKIRRFSFLAGLRGELTHVQWTQHTTGETSDKNPYFNIFPTCFFSYEFSSDNELQLSYTRRISRPKRRTLNPYTNVEDSTNITFGNPDLDPEFTNSFEFNYVKNFNDKKHTFMTSIYYQLMQDVVQKYSWQSGDAVMSTYENMATSHSSGLNLLLKDHWKVVDLTTSVNVFYYLLKGGTFWVNNPQAGENGVEVDIDDRHSFSWSAQLSATFILPQNITMELTGNYRSPKVTAQGKSLSDYYVNFGAKKTFFDKKLSVSLSVRDLLDSRRRKSETWDDDFYLYSESWWSGRTVNLNVSYSFGNMKKKKKDKKKNKISDSSSSSDSDFDDF